MLIRQWNQEGEVSLSRYDSAGETAHIFILGGFES